MKKVAVIGAGSAGLAAAQALLARGLEPTIFESGSAIGGNWRYENDSGMSSCYASLRANTSQRHLAFRCFPLKGRGNAFLPHAEVLDYLEAFTDHFGLLSRIRFRSRVERAEPTPLGGWRLEFDSRREEFDALVVAAGFNNVPRLPELPGTFSGLAIHTHNYRTPDPFRDRDVVVIGLGCSGAEIACEIQRVANSVTICTRSGSWIVARQLGPIPVDWFDMRLSSRLPLAWRRKMLVPIFKLAAGNLSGTALPTPDHVLGAKPITVSDDLVEMVRRGAIRVGPDVVELTPDGVTLRDDSHRPANGLLYATGYSTTFPFLPAEADPPSNERAALYRGVVSLATPNLFFIGLVIGHGALIPMMEAQAGWAAEVLSGSMVLPDNELMAKSVIADDHVRRRNFDRGNGFIWDRLPYCRSLEKESQFAARRPGRAPLRAALATVE